MRVKRVFSEKFKAIDSPLRTSVEEQMDAMDKNLRLLQRLDTVKKDENLKECTDGYNSLKDLLGRIAAHKFNP
eukprot:TRINITY_DN13043_c0_g1_i1.p2 TRINITY_DN13043_c0_g1~~TRINITY_DN13043_c0_g1_i1.p2  ORF type:complete len:73 (+),score=11.08 TRINITY_DN13043_c0_g1_i1:95-313(+)